MLYTVATPIGNIADITKRALKVLSEVELIFAEDTRRTKQLLLDLGLAVPKLISCFDHNERAVSKNYLDDLKTKNIALVCDRGTPTLNDPGFHILRTAQELNVQIVPIPGASAVTTFIQAVGVEGGKFQFVGYLERKKQDLKKQLIHFMESGLPTIFFDSPRRVHKSIETMFEEFPEIRVDLAKELTKQYETFYHINKENLVTWLASNEEPKGEFVGMISFPRDSTKAAKEKEFSLADVLSPFVQEQKKLGKDKRQIESYFKDLGLKRSSYYKSLV